MITWKEWKKIPIFCTEKGSVDSDCWTQTCLKQFKPVSLLSKFLLIELKLILLLKIPLTSENSDPHLLSKIK